MKKPQRRLYPPGCGSREMGRVPKAWETCLLLVQPTPLGPSGLRWWLHVAYPAETSSTAVLLALLLLHRACRTGPGFPFDLLCPQQGFPDKEHAHDTYEGMD